LELVNTSKVLSITEVISRGSIPLEFVRNKKP